MKVDETIESIGRVWQQVVVLIVLHVVFAAFALLAQVIPVRELGSGLQELRSLNVARSLNAIHTSLQSIGLGLPTVAGILSVIYLITFQRLSLILSGIPGLKLSYSQPGLWRASKCFDELRQAAHYFERYSASLALEDLDVAIGIAIAQYRKEFGEHANELIESRVATASLWSIYHSGFGLLFICSMIMVILRHEALMSLLLPAGMIVSMMVARCCWEVQIEHLVLGRLKFALDSALIFEVRVVQEQEVNFSKRGEDTPDRISVFSDATLDNYIWRGPQELIFRNELRITHALSLIWKDFELAADLMKRPRHKIMPYGCFWLMYYVRLLRPLKNSGALPYLSNKVFLLWLHDRVDRLHWEMENDLRGLKDRPGLIDEEQRWYLLHRDSQSPWDLLEQPDRERDRDVHRAEGSFRYWLKKKRSL